MLQVAIIWFLGKRCLYAQRCAHVCRFVCASFRCFTPMRAMFFLFHRWMNAQQSPGFAVQRCPMLLPPLRGWPRSRMDIRTHVTGTQCSMFHSSFLPQAFTSPCFLQLCNVRGEPRWYGQWYPKSCLSSTGHHPTPPSSRLRLHCGQSEASDCTIRLCWLVHLEYRKSDSAPWKLSL